MGRNKRRYGTSSTVSFIYGDALERGGRTPKEAWEIDREDEEAMFSGLSYEACVALADAGDTSDHEDDLPTNDRHLDIHTLPLPPGEEGSLNSHAGDEHSLHTLLSTMTRKTKLNDPRTRADRIQKQVDSWTSQLPHLLKAYLAFSAVGPPSQHDHVETWEIPVIDFNVNRTMTFFHLSDAQSVNDSLVRHGYLGATPKQPQVAFPLHMFSVYRQIHRVCPKFTIDGLSKALQYIHGLPRHDHLEDQRRSAYDAYLTIIRALDNRMMDALNRNDSLSFTTHTCPPCNYELSGETPLEPRILISIDGNNSAKLVDSEVRAGVERIDKRYLPHFRWLEPEEVDRFANEVKAGWNAHLTSDDMDVDNPEEPTTVAPDEIAWLNENETKDLTSCDDTCVERWKAAGPDAQKRTFKLFAISGIFVAVCRHGHVLQLCDMIRSGELMKYPLAIVNSLIDKYGKKLGIGYDIWCAFVKTLHRSPMLRQKVKSSGITGVVPAFHGYAHNRPCQLGYHPMYKEGVGLEDFEPCERTFSLSNALASITRLTNLFHRRQEFSEFFYFHDLDKFALSANFIYQNYWQALERIVKDEPTLERSCEELQITPEICEDLLKQEAEYFSARSTEPARESYELDYVEILERFWAAEQASRDAHIEWKKLGTAAARGWTDKQIKQVQSRNASTYQKLGLIQEELACFEDDNAIYPRWKRADAAYLDAKQGAVEHEYRKAVDDLEHAVVSRLMEMTKLEASDIGTVQFDLLEQQSDGCTGYHQRDKITNTLKARAGAVRNALERYNELALRVPGREQIPWASILNMASVADFDLLRDTHVNVERLERAKPTNQKVMQLHFGLKRAREEIIRLNVEIKHLVTFMIDDEADFWLAIDEIEDGDDEDPTRQHFKRFLQHEYRRRKRLHWRIAERLIQITLLPGFSGMAMCSSSILWTLTWFPGDLTPGEH
ncbi:hypothetical protein VNI00_014204 [Paramarasmius palmivorus]|uniref:CxC1-like cysteine cluster associated with KDZ transposases domain-containing protein n=1 Tax=Paramarasmius palmivorus TaxID=297713 RepID=A0AAW0BU03_9AGAR